MSEREASERPEAGAVADEAGEPAASDETVSEVTEASEPTPAEDPVAEDPLAEGPVAELRRERDAYLELAQRTQADFENYRKRAAREASEAQARAKASLARELLPVLDNLERALAAAGIDASGTAAAARDGDAEGGGEALARGVGLVHSELRSTLERAGVEAYDPLGERFDPALHEALTTRSAAGQEGVVVETLEKGYRMNGQVLRAARVVVGT